MPKVALTDRFCIGAKPDSTGRTPYRDTTTKGLELLVSDTTKAWYWRFTSPKDGKRAITKLGTYPATSLAEARARALEARNLVEAGSDPRDAFKASGADLTVADLIDSYMAKHVRPNLRRAGHMEKRFQKDVRPKIGGVRLADLHRRDINRVLDSILSRGSPTQARLVFQDLRALLRWAVARGDLDHSPMEGLPKPGAEKPRERVLSDAEIRTLWHSLPGGLRKSKACQRIVRLLLVTGQRVGEVAGMRRDELDLKARTWALPGSRTKNGQPHLVPLSDLAVEILEEAPQEAGEGLFVFPCGEGHLAPQAVARTIVRANAATEKLPLGRLGVAPWSAHDLRRTVLTNFAKLGIQPVVAGAVANHLSVTKATVTLSVYTQYTYDREKREALELWADRLRAIVDGKGAEVTPLRQRRA